MVLRVAYRPYQQIHIILYSKVQTRLYYTRFLTCVSHTQTLYFGVSRVPQSLVPPAPSTVHKDKMRTQRIKRQIEKCTRTDSSSTKIMQVSVVLKVTRFTFSLLQIRFTAVWHLHIRRICYFHLVYVIWSIRSLLYRHCVSLPAF